MYWTARDLFFRSLVEFHNARRVFWLLWERVFFDISERAAAREERAYLAVRRAEQQRF